LFCDFGNGLGPQYIDLPLTAVPDCVSALESQLSISVSGGASCAGGVCSAGVSAGGCNAAGSSGFPLASALFAGLGLALASMARRRKA
jgi:hypothetical protein